MPVVRPAYPNELYHYGVKGMHWGVRRYQPYPKGYSGSGKYLGKRSKVGLFGNKSKTKVRRLTDDEKMRLIRDGSSTDLLKYSSQLSTNELSEGLRRLQTKRSLSNERSEWVNNKIKMISTPMSEAGKILKSGTNFFEFANARAKNNANKYSFNIDPYDPSSKEAKDYDWSKYTKYNNEDWINSGIKGGKKVDRLSKNSRGKIKGKYRDAWNEEAKRYGDKYSEEQVRRGRNRALARGLGWGALAGYGAYKTYKATKAKKSLPARVALGLATANAGVRSFGYLGASALGTTALKQKRKQKAKRKKGDK